MREFDMDMMGQSYLFTALWSSVDESGEPLDDEYEYSDFTKEAQKEARRDCKDFVRLSSKSIQFLLENKLADEASIGHEFWLTRNRHGAGFWDRGYPGHVGQMLTKDAHSFGETHAYAYRGKVRFE